MVIVPQITNENVPVLLAKLKPTGNPVSISVVPEDGTAPNECFDNVAAKILRDGGERIVGWQLWQHPFMLEAEYHAVWRSPEGSIVDITPKNIRTDHILFVEDRNRPYEGRQLDNLRQNTTANQLIDDFIALAETKFYLLNYGERAFQKEVFPSDNEMEILKYIQGMMMGINTMILAGKVRNSPCFCNSGTKYKQCHGKDLVGYLNTARS